MISYPQGVYLETTVLYNLPLDVITADMERLKQLCELLETPILLPETSLEEWMAHRKRAVKQWTIDVEKGLGNLTKIFHELRKVDWPKDREGMCESMKLLTRKIVEDNGISIIETPGISVRQLLDMAVNRERPFEEGHEKGFRDTLNLLTVLEYAKKRKDGTHILITNDQIYTHKDVLKRAERYGVTLEVVASISDTISILENFLRGIKKEFDEYEKSILKGFLLKNAKRVSKSIKQKGVFARSFLNKGGELGLFFRVRSIEDIEVIGINSVTRGTLSKNGQEHRVRVSATVETRLHVRIEQSLLPPEPRFKYGMTLLPTAGATLAAALGPTEQPTLSKEIEKVVPVTRNIVIDGSAYFREGKARRRPGRGEYSHLQIDNVIPVE